MSGPRAVKPYVWPHGLVMDAEGIDAMRDDALCPTVWDEDAPQRRIDLSPRRAAQPSGAPNRPISSRADDHDAPGGELSSSLPGRVAPLTNEAAAAGSRDGS
jgi:hypothetical protein